MAIQGTMEDFNQSMKSVIVLMLLNYIQTAPESSHGIWSGDSREGNIYLCSCGGMELTEIVAKNLPAKS